MKIYTKDTLIERLIEIKEMGWIKNSRAGNCGGIGNTLEDLLGIKENNLPIPNAAEWELKCQRIKTASLVTLFHMEPSPVALKFVSQIFLPKYGWSHKEAGRKYSDLELSFRQTISCRNRSERGFTVLIDTESKKVLVSFDKNSVRVNHQEWLESVINKTGGGELEPQPYWGFKDIYHKAGTKLHNCFFIEADSRFEANNEFFKYEKIWMLSGFSLDRFIRAIELGNILIDFDARTGHNHGTKFRLRNNRLPDLYENVVEIN